MPADRPACHYSTNAAWDTSSPYWGQTEQAWVSCRQTLKLVWNDFAIAYFHIQYCLTFCKWQLVIKWHHGSIKAGGVHPAASREPSWEMGKEKDVRFFPPKQNKTAHRCRLQVTRSPHQTNSQAQLTLCWTCFSRSHHEKIDSNQNGNFGPELKCIVNIKHSPLVEDSMNTPADDNKDCPTINQSITVFISN